MYFVFRLCGFDRSSVAQASADIDIRVRNLFDPVSMLLRPLYVLKSEHTVTSETVMEALFG